MSRPAGPAAQRAAALAAIEARLKGGSVETTIDQPKAEPVWVQPSEKDDAESRKVLSRLLDRGIVRDNGYRQSAEAVETLLKIASNIQANSEEKYRTLKATNSALKNKVLSVKGGHDYLIAMGFRVRTVDFTQTYVLEPSMKRMHELNLAAEILQDHYTSIQSRAEASNASKSYAAQEEAQRKARALREYEEDRDKVKARVERERKSRETRERLAREEAERLKAEAMDEEESTEPTEPGRTGRRLGDVDGVEEIESTSSESARRGRKASGHDDLEYEEEAGRDF